jgi:hypothetical protein
VDAEIVSILKQAKTEYAKLQALAK